MTRKKKKKNRTSYNQFKISHKARNRDEQVKGCNHEDKGSDPQNPCKPGTATERWRVETGTALRLLGQLG